MTPLPPSRFWAAVFELGVEKLIVVTRPADKVAGSAPAGALTVTEAAAHVGAGSASDVDPTTTVTVVPPAHSVETPWLDNEAVI